MVREVLNKVEPLGWRITVLATHFLKRIERAWGRAALLAALEGEPITSAAVAREADVFRRLREEQRRDPSG